MREAESKLQIADCKLQNEKVNALGRNLQFAFFNLQFPLLFS